MASKSKVKPTDRAETQDGHRKRHNCCVSYLRLFFSCFEQRLFFCSNEYLSRGGGGSIASKSEPTDRVKTQTSYDDNIFAMLPTKLIIFRFTKHIVFCSSENLGHCGGCRHCQQEQANRPGGNRKTVMKKNHDDSFACMKLFLFHFDYRHICLFSS